MGRSYLDPARDCGTGLDTLSSEPQGTARKGSWENSEVFVGV